MSKLLLNLRQVLPDEAEDVRDLLRGHDIDFYETRPSPWGISAGGLWLRDAGDFARAKQCMDEYQASRRERVRAQRLAERDAGTAETFAGNLRARPWQVLGILLAMLLVIGLTLSLPWWLLAR